MGKKNITTNMSSVAFFNLLGPIILNGVNFFTTPIFTRILGTDNYGIYSLYLTYLTVVTIIIGLQVQGTIAPASVNFIENEQNQYLSSITTLALCNFIILLIPVLLFIKPISYFIGMSVVVIVILLFHSFFNFCCNLSITYYTFRKYSYKSFIISVTIALANIILSLIILNYIKDSRILYMGRVIGNALPTIIVGGILIVAIFIKGKVFFSKDYWKFCLSLSVPLVFHGLSQIILSQSDRIMMKNITGSDSLIGIYSLSYSLASILNVIWGALNNTWVPFYYDYAKSNDVKSINQKSKNYLQVYTILTMGFILLCPEIIKVCSSQDFWEAIKLTPILAVSMFIMFLYSFPVNFEFFNKKTKSIAIGTVVSAICNIALNFLLIPKLNMFGAAIATLISYIILFTIHHLICLKFIKNNYHYKLKLFIPYITYVLVCCILFYLTIDIWLIRWGIGVLLGLYLIYEVIKRKSIF